MAIPQLQVYVETSVWSMALADDVPDYRSDTEEFLDLCRRRVILPAISLLVAEEVSQADRVLRGKLEKLIAEIRPEIFPLSDRALALADAFLAAGVVPPSKPADAGHVAVAFDARLDLLVSWNFRHIVNVRRAERFNAVAVLQGYHHELRIVSPSEVLYAEDDT